MVHHIRNNTSQHIPIIFWCWVVFYENLFEHLSYILVYVLNSVVNEDSDYLSWLIMDSENEYYKRYTVLNTLVLTLRIENGKLPRTLSVYCKGSPTSLTSTISW